MFPSFDDVSTIFNHCALLLYGWSHIQLHNFTLSWLPGLMPLLLFSFSILSHSFDWFVWNIWFWTFCFVLASYHVKLADVATTLYFTSSITAFSPWFFTLYLFSCFSFIVSLWSSFLLHQSKLLRSLLNEFILSFIFFLHLGSWGFTTFVLKPSFLAT